MKAINYQEYDQGCLDGIHQYEPGELTGDPVGKNDDYILGFWCGVGIARAFAEGYEAACKGIIACPYMIDADDECFREPWLSGFWEAVNHGGI